MYLHWCLAKLSSFLATIKCNAARHCKKNIFLQPDERLFIQTLGGTEFLLQATFHTEQTLQDQAHKIFFLSQIAVTALSILFFQFRMLI